MSELVGGASRRRTASEAGGGSAKRARGRLALELVAMRGKDVVGVRHVQEGGTAWVGNVTDTIARVPMREFGGHPFMVGDVRAGTYTIQVPPRARARVHGSDGIPRLVVGPHRVDLREGERAVVVLGGVQIRAQVVPFEVPAPRFKLTAGVAAWVAVLGAVYLAAMALTASAVQQTPAKAEPGAIQKIHAKILGPR